MTCLCPLFQRIQNVNLWVGSWAVSLASWVAPIAHARLNRASLTWCTQLDTIFRWSLFVLVVCIQLDKSFSYVAMFQCPTVHAPLLIWLYIFFLKGQYSLTVCFKTISTQCSWPDFLIFAHAAQYGSTIWPTFWKSTQETSLVSQNLSFAISVTWTFSSFSPLVC
jgi:hypothetical protein